MEQSETPDTEQCVDNVVNFPDRGEKVTYVSPEKEEDFGYDLQFGNYR